MHSISIGILRKVIISVGYANISPIKGEINLSLSASQPLGRLTQQAETSMSVRSRIAPQPFSPLWARCHRR
jgi:hypothetical protein